MRYRRARLEDDAEDGRAGKPFRAEVVGGVIEQWVSSHEGVGVLLLAPYERLVSDYGYEGSHGARLYKLYGRSQRAICEARREALLTSEAPPRRRSRSLEGLGAKGRTCPIWGEPIASIAHVRPSAPTPAGSGIRIVPHLHSDARIGGELAVILADGPRIALQLTRLPRRLESTPEARVEFG